MKKIIIFLIITISFIPLFTNQNDYKDITTVNYISSIGIDYNKETREYIVYSYILNNLNLSSNTSSPGDSKTISYIIKNQNSNFNEAFFNIKKQTNINIFYSHLETIILSTNFLNSDNIKLFYSFIKDSIEIYPTFYIYTTTSKLDEIFNIQFLSDISGYHTLLVNPTLLSNHYNITYIDFAKMYLKDNFTLLIPNIISIKDILSKNNQNSNLLLVNGYTIINPDLSHLILIQDSYDNIKWLMKQTNQYLKIDDYILYVKKNNYKIKRQNGKLIIIYNLSAILTQNNTNNQYTIIENELTSKIKSLINKLISETLPKDIDLFNLYYYSNSNNIDINDIDIKINLNLN